MSTYSIILNLMKKDKYEWDAAAELARRYNLTSLTIKVAKKIADALGISADALFCGSNEQRVSNKLNDEEELLLFHKVQQLNDENITSVKE